MAKLIHGERIGTSARLLTGCAAVIFDQAGECILLTRRTDNGRWCLPGGAAEPGESVEEACIREVREETSLDVRVIKLIGVYSSPDIVVEYGDGNRWQIISMTFEAEIIGGTLSLSNETTDYGYFSSVEIETLDLMEHHVQRIADAFTHQERAFIR